MIGNILCRLGFHDYVRDRRKREIQYRKYRCERCGDLDYRYIDA